MFRMAAFTAYRLFAASALVPVITLALKWCVHASAVHTVGIFHALVAFFAGPAGMTDTFPGDRAGSVSTFISANC